MSVVYLNGDFISEEQASIPITDRGFLFGDGVFTTLKIEEGNIHHATQHLQRISQHCEQLNIRPPTINEDVLLELVKRNNAEQGIWRMKIIVTGGALPDLSLPLRQHGTILITMKEIHDLPMTPANLVIYPDHIQTPSSRLKSLSYLERLQVRQYAVEKGADDALVLSGEGYILEASFSNIFWIKGDDLFTPKPALPLLQGITLQKHIVVAKERGMNIQEGDYSLGDIPSDASIYLCNTITEKRLVKSITPSTSLEHR